MTLALWTHRRILEALRQRDAVVPVLVARDAFLERQMKLFALRENTYAPISKRPAAIQARRR